MKTEEEYRIWMKRVDAILAKHLGLTSGDMRDRLWRDAFEDDLSPEEAIDDLVGSLEDEDLEQTMEDELFG